MYEEITIKELIEAIRPIVEQDPEIMFRGHREDYVNLKAIPLCEFHRLRTAFEAVDKKE